MNAIQESLQHSLRLVESDNRLIFCQKPSTMRASRSPSIGNNSPSRKVLYSLMMNHMYHSVYHACNLEGI